ncbi:hypothetical protein ACTQ33_14825 [Candidatus Avoscillospira sp. LCP25S3_F1]|uniref:hypothetical protein n=1 Tax=Candidatus Avoscillospira sp. LCP25S3_F1 TaxID=3438825 RepID=UPI003F905B07
MGLFRKLKAVLRDDWCGTCQVPMDTTFQRIYTLPMTVGHYRAHKNPAYYLENLRRVSGEIMPGVYVCELTAYRCPDCGHRVVRLCIYLPVRGNRKFEDTYEFTHGELDELLRQP